MSYYIRTALATIAVIFVSVIGVEIAIYSRSQLVFHGFSEDGTEFVIYQCAQPLELCFDTKFFYRKANGTWKSHYYDHEDESTWKAFAVSFDDESKQVTFDRDGRADIRFNWEQEIFERNSTSGFLVDSIGSYERHPGYVEHLLGSTEVP